MFSRIAHVCLAVALLCATGTHWAMPQSVAWATMLASHAQTDSLAVAFEKTFDGRHPCALCKKIARARHSEHKSDQNSDLKRFDLFNEQLAFILNPPGHFIVLRDRDAFISLLAHSPPVPPPKNFIA